MPPKSPFLLSARVYLLRFVVSLSVASLLLLLSGPFLWEYEQLSTEPFRHQHWLALGLVIFILVHHLLMPFNMDPFYGLVDFPLLLLEVAGLGYYIPFMILSVPSKSVARGVFMEGYPDMLLELVTNAEVLGAQAPVHNCTVVYCIFAIFLSLEALLRMGSLILYLFQHGVLLHHRSLTAEENLKPHQVMFGQSTSVVHLSGTTSTAMPKLSTHYYVSSTQMKFVVSGRIFLLRVVLISSFASMVLLPSIWTSLKTPDFFWFSMLMFVIFHHLVSCVNLEFDYGIADLAALIFEITNVAAYMTELGSINTWSYMSMIMYTILAWVIFTSLVLEALIWVGCLIMYIIQHVLGPTMLSFWVQENPKPYKVLFGRAAWNRHFNGENNIIRLSRGLFATTLVLMLLFSLVTNVLLGPIQETGLTPTKDLRSLEPPLYLKGDTPSWNVVFITPVHENRADIRHAVTVKPLWNNQFHGGNTQCNLDSVGYIVPPLKDPHGTYFIPVSENSTISGLQVNKFHCLARSKPELQDSRASFPLPDSNITPDLLITVNFTTLGLLVGTTSDLFKNSVQVMIGLSNDTVTVVERTVPTALVPGTNLIGITTWDLRQLLKSPRLSAFGSLFDSHETIVVSRMLNVYPDPLASKDPLIQQGHDISTFRVTMQYDHSELRALQDYRSRTVLQGFSQVGGLWTFLAGVFVAIFGSSIIQIIFGGKPISFFGLARSMQRKELRNNCCEKYPKIMEQLQQPADERGLLSFICDQLIDLEFLEAEVKEKDTDSIEYKEVDQVEMSDF